MGEALCLILAKKKFFKNGLEWDADGMGCRISDWAPIRHRRERARERERRLEAYEAPILSIRLRLEAYDKQYDKQIERRKRNIRHWCLDARAAKHNRTTNRLEARAAKHKRTTTHHLESAQQRLQGGRAGGPLR